MTVSSIVPVNNYTGNSSTKIFDFDFLIENEKELVVQYQDKNGIVSILQHGVDYSINEIGNKNGSYIEFPLNDSHYGILQPDEQISLALSLQIKQESEFHNSSYFNLGVLEWTFDYIVRILQILNRKIDRCVKVEESISISPDEIINEINDKYEKVNSTYLQIVEVSKDVEENKNISIQQTNATFENAEIAKNQADLAIQKAKEAGLIVGEKIAIFSSNEYVPECCLPCDGAIYQIEQFKDFCDNYMDESNPLLNVCSLEEYELAISTNGECSKFGVDFSNGIFRVPLIIDEKLKYFVVVANGEIKESFIDWNALASSLQYKLNYDHSNDSKPYIIEMEIDSSDGYIVYSNGVCEQWGFVTNTATKHTFNLYRPYSDIYYNKQVTFTAGNATDTGGIDMFSGLHLTNETSTTTTSFTATTLSGRMAYWRTIGKLA